MIQKDCTAFGMPRSQIITGEEEYAKDKTLFECSALRSNSYNRNTCRSQCAYRCSSQQLCRALRAAGFPDSYIRALSALHTAYPQWQFQAVKTGLDWNTVVSKESVNGVNLVPKTGNDATKSTADGAYDWTTNVWTVYDGSSWVGANSKYIAYYLDPRNFLNETDIFQFESLSFSKVQTKQGVSSILKGTFMENTVEDSDGSTLDYAQAFMDIGEETGVSPYHLASRVRQEQGLKGTSSLISGTYSGYKGYYNYFNVGAAGLPPHWSSKTDCHMQKSGMEYPVCST